MEHNHNVVVTVTSSNCPFYAPGDKIYFKGACVDKDRSGNLCMVALNAIYPFAYAARRGPWIKPGEIQCPDCDECVKFTVALDE